MSDAVNDNAPKIGAIPTGGQMIVGGRVSYAPIYAGIATLDMNRMAALGWWSLDPGGIANAIEQRLPQDCKVLAIPQNETDILWSRLRVIIVGPSVSKLVPVTHPGGMPPPLLIGAFDLPWSYL